jgi:hypothetical protein
MTRIDHKVLPVVLLLGLTILFGAIAAPIYAQQAAPTASATQAASGAGGQVCVLAYEDTNKNGTRDPGESLLSSVGVSLMVNSNVIVANHITDGTEPFCFRNLSAQQYTVGFSSPLAQATTLTSFTFPLGAGEQISKEYGAITSLATEAAPGSAGLAFSSPVRIGLSAGGAVIAMAFIGAIGMIFYGLFWRRIRR